MKGGQKSGLMKGFLAVTPSRAWTPRHAESRCVCVNCVNWRRVNKLMDRQPQSANSPLCLRPKGVR